ncbi:MAG: arginyltransferase [Desulfobacterales bacterium]|nr:MAG: arginyltransferase [Desulfobacterales bacterium]
MSKYDRECSLEFSALKRRIDTFFVNAAAPCPYTFPYTATYCQGMFGPLPDRVMELFLAAGYRRNGNALYTMRCRSCRKCIPIRLHPPTFTPNRNQKRVWRKNSDLDVSIAAIQPTVENMSLCDTFLQERYPGDGNRADAYYAGFFLNRITTTCEVRYRIEGRLVGNAVVDLGENWGNAVYFFFDPAEAKRGLGTYNILTLIKLFQKKGIDYLYLGYTIPGLSAMSYKMNFKPHYLYLDDKWVEGNLQ